MKIRFLQLLVRHLFYGTMKESIQSLDLLLQIMLLSDRISTKSWKYKSTCSFFLLVIALRTAWMAPYNTAKVERISAIVSAYRSKKVGCLCANKIRSLHARDRAMLFDRTIHPWNATLNLHQSNRVYAGR